MSSRTLVTYEDDYAPIIGKRLLSRHTQGRLLSSPITLMPHAVCWAASPRLIWTMVVTNFITFASYLIICLTLLYVAARTGRVLPREWRFFVVGFALFIVACGSTHLLEIVTTWSPVFWVDAWANIITAFLSAFVAILLIRRSPIISFGINDYAARLKDSENEKQRMEHSLLAARKLEDWSRMSAAVAHEIASPLESIHNLLFLIRNAEHASPEISELAHVAADEAQRVMTITRSTLGFFRQASEPESIDLRTAAESVRFLLEASGRQKRVGIDIRVSGEVSVHALPGEARQVLLNLVRNAVEATSKPNSTVAVSLNGLPEGVEIAVADQGAGMNSAMLASLFQFGKSTKGDAGSGMGLWTVKHILEKHHGSVDVQSTLGQGTCFTLFWPRDFHSQRTAAPSSRTLQTVPEKVVT